MRSLVVFSGGLDSTVCLLKAIALSSPDDVMALTFDYGQKHKVEIEAAKAIALHLGVKHEEVSTGGLLEHVGSSALLDSAIAMDSESPQNQGLPASFVPGRNILFLTIACSIAYVRDIPLVWTGVCQADAAGYPDCRFETIWTFVKAMRLALSWNSLDIRTPLIDHTKADTWALAHKLGYLEFVTEHTHTCYNGVRDHLHTWGYGCGPCPACKERAEGYRQFQEMVRNGVV
jgi:7-cyano-7-deazaguanine synthase